MSYGTERKMLKTYTEKAEESKPEENIDNTEEIPALESENDVAELDIEPNLEDSNGLNRFYVLENNNDNFQLLIDEFDIKTFEQIEQTYLFTCNDDNYIQPMKYLTNEKKWIWIIRGLSKKSYYNMINLNRAEIINELMKHYVYINWNSAIIDILEGDIIND